MTDPTLKKNSDTWPVNPGLRIGALNICSLPNKLDDLSVLLNNHGNHLHILGICESAALNSKSLKIKWLIT